MRPHVVVGNPRSPQMLRWFLWQSWRDKRRIAGKHVRWIDRFLDFNVCIHKWLRDDPPGFHDHSWWNMTIMLKGGFLEWRPSTPPTTADVEWVWAGKIIIRQATEAHRVKLGHEGKPAWTLFITGRWRRHWGYWRDGAWIDGRFAR